MGNAPSALHQAVLSGDVARCRVAVQERPSEIDATEPLNGWTGLHIASANGYDVIVRELLARGAALNVVDKEGRTPLHLAAAGGHQTVVKDLLRRGADPLRKDLSSKTPLDVALEKQQGSVISLLSDALAGRGIVTPTTGSPAAWQGRAAQQSDIPVTPATGGRVLLPDLRQLDVQASPAAAGPGSLYPPVIPAPPADDAWLQDLPPPPPASVAVPSAPPPYMAAPAGSGATIQQQQQQQQQLPDYYSYIRPLPPAAPIPAAGAPYPAAGGLGGSDTIPPYPSVPSAATPVPGASAYPSAHPGGSVQQQQQQQQQWPTAAARPQVVGPLSRPQQQQQVEPHPISVGSAGATFDEDDWGPADEDDWGTRPSVNTAHPAGAGGGAKTDLGAAASKVVGAVASTAAAGAKHLLTQLLKPPTKVVPPENYSDMPGATTAGPAGRTYRYDDLARATGGFGQANKLGSGGYGPVYRGVLDGVPVAVKLLEPNGLSSQGPREFASEVAILSRLHHPHIVLLMGSCPERYALVYELMDYGSLEQHLFNQVYPDLQWQDRLRIACEVVSALVFLHSAPEAIIHMDLKPANLLLSKGLVCKVGDVGLSRLMPGVKGQQGDSAAAGGLVAPVSTILDSRLVGTPSYMDPEYLRTGRFGPKSDTYSLGVILLQMLTGMDATRVVSVVEAALARSQRDPASFSTVVDSRSGSWPITEAASFAHLAMRCVELSRTNRPDLRSEVLPALLQLAERAQLYDCRALKKSVSLSSSNQPPSMFICPVTQDVMDDPVFAADGYTYERAAIAGWIQYHDTSPMTNLPLAHRQLTPNLGLRSAIRDWQDKHARTS